MIIVRSYRPSRNVHHANARPKWNEFISARAQRSAESGAVGQSYANKFVIRHRINDELLAPARVRRSAGRFEWQCRQLDGIWTCRVALRRRMERGWQWLSSRISFVRLAKTFCVIHSLTLSHPTVASSSVPTTTVSTTAACWTPTASQWLRRSTKCTESVSRTSRACCHRHRCIHTRRSAPTWHPFRTCHWSMNPMSHMPFHRTWRALPLRRRRSSNRQRRWWTRKWNILTQLTFPTIVTWRAEAAAASLRTSWLITITLTRCHIRARWTATEPRRDRKRATRRLRRARTSTWPGMRSERAHCTFRFQ